MLYFIVNPSSSSGNGTATWEKVKKILNEKNAEYECILLNGPGHAKEIASVFSQAETDNTIIIVGGDGTINEFLQGITCYDHIIFSCIPTGSGNDFARSMRLPSNLKDLVDMILSSDQIRNINIGNASDSENEHLFIVSSGIGFDASVCHETNHNAIKKILNYVHLGKLSYTINALVQIFSMKFIHLRIVLDDQTLLSFDKTYFAAAMNMKYEGGGFMFAPKASPVDGEFDLMVVEGIPRIILPFLLPTAYFGKHVRFKGIHLYRCKKAVIQCSHNACVHTDGEHFGFTNKITYEIKKDRLKTIVD